MNNRYEKIKEEIISTRSISNESATYLIGRGKIKASKFKMSQEDKEDAIADAMLTFLETVENGKFDPQYSVSTYFLRLVEVECLKKFKVRSCKIFSLDKDLDQNSAAEEYIDESNVLLETIENVLRTDAQIKTLKLMLQDKKGKEIAEALGVTTQMVSVYMKQIRALCEKKLENWKNK